MRVVVDARWIFPEISGIGEYTRELIRAVADIDPDTEYQLLLRDGPLRDRLEAELRPASRGNVGAVSVPYGVFSPANQLRLPGLLRRLGADVFHSPNYMIPFLAFPRHRRGRTACVVTLHDVIPLLFPSSAPRSRKARWFPLYRQLMIEVGRRADVIITDSDASRNDVIRCLHLSPRDASKVRTIHCGIARRFAEAPPVRRPAEAGDGRLLLYVGRSDPYKNVTGLIRIFKAARERAPMPLRLCIAGSPDPRYPEAVRLAAELGLSDAVTWTGYLSDEALTALYRRADVLVHPSRYEGFGLQVAEAMASGTPVVCSRAGSLPEVAGDAALMLDPDDIDGFADAVVRVIVDERLSAELRAKGRARAAGFTWARAARETLAVYRAVADRTSHRGSGS